MVWLDTVLVKYQGIILVGGSSGGCEGGGEGGVRGTAGGIKSCFCMFRSRPRRHAIPFLASSPEAGPVPSLLHFLRMKEASAIAEKDKSGAKPSCIRQLVPRPNAKMTI